MTPNTRNRPGLLRRLCRVVGGQAILMTAVAGCRIAHPPGYALLQVQSPSIVQATPGVVYGSTPWSWDLPDGRQVHAIRERLPIRLFQVDVAFRIGLVHGQPIGCQTDAQVEGMPPTSFGCWSLSSESHTDFWFDNGPACLRASQTPMRTLNKPACWTGQLAVGEQRYAVRFAHMQRTGVVVGRVTWTNPSGRVVMAANLGGHQRIVLYRNEPLADAHADALLINAIALHRYLAAF